MCIRDSIWRIKRKNRSNGLACRRVEEPKKCSKFRTGGVYISPIWGAKTPEQIEPIFFCGKGPRRNHAIQIWWRSVHGFWVGWGSKFAFSHRLWRSSLQHSHYPVRCDGYIQTSMTYTTFYHQLTRHVAENGRSKFSREGSDSSGRMVIFGAHSPVSGGIPYGRWRSVALRDGFPIKSYTPLFQHHA